MAYDEDAPPPAKPSQAPSWVLLGFVLGALCVFALPRKKPAAAPVTPPDNASLQAPTLVVHHQILSRFLTVEELFTENQAYAVWDNDRTEICVWDPDIGQFAECYEVIRRNGDYYFKTITSLTQPVLTHGVPANSLIQFTETAAQRAQWLKDVNDEAWRSLAGSRNPPPPTPTPAVPTK